MTDYIKNLININKSVNEAIPAIEKTIKELKIESDKDKANFGNLVLVLKSYRIVSDTTEAMLSNDDVLIDDNGDYYQKIEVEDTPKEESEKE